MPSKHSPGPWVINDRDGKRFIEAEDDSTAYETGYVDVAFVPRNEIGRRGKYPPQETTLANARLIAAAPELLDALRESLESARLAAIHQPPEGYGEFCPWYEKGIELLRRLDESEVPDASR